MSVVSRSGGGALSACDRDPYVLLDDPDNDAVRECAWVERVVHRDEALRVIAEVDCRELHVVGTEWMAPRTATDQTWEPCAPTADGAREFWVVKPYGDPL